MKNFLLITLISTFLFACQNSGQDNKLENKIFGGERELRKMTNSQDMSVKSSFFLLSGSSSTKSQAIVTFAWKINDSTYQISSIPRDKIRVRFNSAVIYANIKFYFKDDPYKPKAEKGINEDIQEFLNSYLAYVEIYVKESDWPVNINLPFESEVK